MYIGMKLSRTWKVLIAILSVVIILLNSYYFASSKTVEKMTNMNKYIDIIYYINLDHRDDRKIGFLEEMNKIDYPEDNIVRIPGVYKKGQGSLGCSLSHLKALETFVQSGYETCIILEDDFGFSETKEHVEKSITQLFESGVEFDVCMLACWDQEVEPVDGYDFIKKVNRGLTTSGYIVTKKFAPILLDNFKQGSTILEQKFKENSKYVTEFKYEIDEYWVQIQTPNNWYMFYPKLGKQRDSYSDVREREKIVEYDF